MTEARPPTGWIRGDFGSAARNVRSAPDRLVHITDEAIVSVELTVDHEGRTCTHWLSFHGAALGFLLGDGKTHTFRLDAPSDTAHALELEAFASVSGDTSESAQELLVEELTVRLERVASGDAAELVYELRKVDGEGAWRSAGSIPLAADALS
jgi:hypothetical protein